MLYYVSRWIIKSIEMSEYNPFYFVLKSPCRKICHILFQTYNNSFKLKIQFSNSQNKNVNLTSSSVIYYSSTAINEHCLTSLLSVVQSVLQALRSASWRQTRQKWRVERFQMEVMCVTFL